MNYKNRITPELIENLGVNEIFVFGSNLEGNHAGGAAKLAAEKFGAIMGKGIGIQGQSYAIPTMQGSVETIKPHVDKFIHYARENSDKTFLVTKIGCGIAGFSVEEIAPLFYASVGVKNIYLPEDFWKYITTNERIVKAFKGFDKDMKCRGFQYKTGEEYAIKGDIEVCNKGFHACPYPLDVFG